MPGWSTLTPSRPGWRRPPVPAATCKGSNGARLGGSGADDADQGVPGGGVLGAAMVVVGGDDAGHSLGAPDVEALALEVRQDVSRGVEHIGVLRTSRALGEVRRVVGHHEEG